MKALSAFLDDITAVFADAEAKGCDLTLPADLVRLFAPAFREAAEAARQMEAGLSDRQAAGGALAPLPVKRPPASPLARALNVPGSNILLFPIVPRPVSGRDPGDETGGDAA